MREAIQTTALDSQIKLSVIIPARDALGYLPAAIASIEDAARTDLEIIVVDDGSRDGSGEWLAQIIATESRLKVLTLDGLGVANARNMGIFAAQGQWIAFLDADDLWRPGKLSQQLAFHHKNPDVVMSFTDYEHVDPDGKSYGTSFEYWPQFRRMMLQTGATGDFQVLQNAAARVFAENAIGTSTVMVRRDAMIASGGFRRDLQIAEDFDMWLRLAAMGPVAASPMVGTEYLVRPGSASRNLPMRQACLRDVFSLHWRRVIQQSPAAVLKSYGRILEGDAGLPHAWGQSMTALRLAGAAIMTGDYRPGRAALGIFQRDVLGFRRSEVVQ
ncbi:MAG: glycosyltransferase family 2 protein [Pseudomonadota bacterium]